MLRFSTLLGSVGIDPASVRLLRHQPTLASGAHLLDLWRSDPQGFEGYQSLQLRAKRSFFAHPCWASFIGTWDGRTVFAGLYAVSDPEPVESGCIEPLTGELCERATTDRYRLDPVAAFAPYAGRLLIDWGGGSSGKRAWVQRADRQDKTITAILEHAIERSFPGFMAFHARLDELASLPLAWAEKLLHARGVYLLSCRDTGTTYTGSATGHGGFWARWQDYAVSGHGGNVGLRTINTSRFQVSILQLAGSADTQDDILAMEQLWKTKLLSREFGFNRN